MNINCYEKNTANTWLSYLWNYKCLLVGQATIIENVSRPKLMLLMSIDVYISQIRNPSLSCEHL